MTTAWRDAGAVVLDDLIARIDAVDRRCDRLRTGEVAAELEAIRRIAVRHGLTPALTVVHAIDSALSRGERGPLVHTWLDMLRDAVGCGPGDARACDTYAAACTVRLAR